MSVFYQVAYRVGFYPWEELADHPPFTGKLSELLDREEAGREPPYGRALDVGTGSGIWGVELAKRGWEVTGVDIVEPALRRARERADDAAVDMRIVKADVTTLKVSEVGGGFRLVLDTGTFHGLNRSERRAMGSAVSAVAAQNATVLLDVFAPRHRGATRADVEDAFPDWRVTDVAVADTDPDAIARVLKFDEHFYRLRRDLG